MDILVRDRKDAPCDGKNISHAVDRLVKRAGNAVHRSKKEVSKALPGKASLGKSVIEQLLHRRLRICKRHDAVSDVARRQHAEVLSEHAGASAVVCDGDDRRNKFCIALESAQHRRQTVPAADGNDVRHAFFGLI